MCGLVLVGEFDENILEARSERPNFSDGHAMMQQLVAEVVQIENVGAKS